MLQNRNPLRIFFSLLRQHYYLCKNTFPARCIIIALVLLNGCAQPKHSVLRDVAQMPQDPVAYLDMESATTPLLDHKAQDILAQDFLSRHFSPWKASGPLPQSAHPFWALKWIETAEVFGHNLRPLAPARIKELHGRCAEADYPSMQRHAISISHTDVRALPTSSPMFNNPDKAGEGFPFDYLQHGVIPAGSPLIVTHKSTDGNWYFIETPLLYGWVPTTSIAWVDAAFMDTYTGSEYAAILEDGHCMQSKTGKALPPARAGSILPLMNQTPGGYTLAMPQADLQGDATLEYVSVSPSIASPFPIPFTQARIAAVCTNFMHQPYSWGDRFTGRDCSGTMRDIFVPFGIWLPRNSGDQAETGEIIPLDAFSTANKIRHIKERALPFVTLLHLPGHIMLYVGEYEGRIAVLHAIWGLKSSTFYGAEGRIRIGETLITSLQPGQEMDNIFRDISSLRERLDKMNIPHRVQRLREHRTPP